MDLPDFDTLKRMAQTEPERLDELLHQQVEALLEGASPERQRSLRGLQFRIDCQRRLAKNPMDSCLRISNMMHDSFYNMRCALNMWLQKQNAGRNPSSRGNNREFFFENNREHSFENIRENNREDNIVSLLDYHHRQK